MMDMAMEATRILPRQAQQSGGNAGTHRSSGSSLSALLSTLIPVFIGATVLFIAFLILRKKLDRVYQPRTYIGSLRNWQLSPKQSTGILGWRKEYSELRDEFVMGHASIDNYLWLRFFRMMATMCFVGCLITWPILFPVNATGNVSSATGLDILSFSHINPGPRYYAHVFVAWIFLSWVMFMITRESRFFVRLRQQYMLTPFESSRVSTRTILFTDVPEEARTEEHFREQFSLVRKVWLVNVPEELADKVDDRDSAAAKLETGEMKLIQKYIKNQKKAEKNQTNGSPKDDRGHITFDDKIRPTHRLPKLKFLPIGKKVDTLQWTRQELHRLIPEVAHEQRKLLDDHGHVQGACFVEFETVEAANTAMQKGGLKSLAKMTPKELGPTPENIIWKNAIKPKAKVASLNLICTAFVWFLCLFWTIPVAVIGAITNINYLTDKVPFLSFINDIPSVILGVVTGLLPVLLLAILMKLVPILCNILAKLFEPTQSAVQLKVQAWYFPFQVIQVFLITTFASGAAAVVTEIINQPSSAATLLARNLPKASNFYIAYFILFGLMTAVLQILNIVPLLLIVVLGRFLDTTPRKLYNRYVNLAGLGWGSLYPKFTNLGVIALSYSCIAPLILGFATIGFVLLYLAYRYNTLFTLGTQVSTRGESYGRAMHQLTTGIYLSEVCLIGLFAIGIGQTTQSVGPLVLMIAFLIATICWHVWLGRSLSKMEETMPKALMIDEHPRHDPEKALLANHGGPGDMQEKHAESPNARNSAAGGSIMDRVKGYLAPSNAADNVVLSMAGSLGTPVRDYTEYEHDTAYVHPAIASECPIIWIAKDEYGLSSQEIHKTKSEVGEGLEMTDRGATINYKGKLEWNQDKLEDAPVWEDEPIY